MARQITLDTRERIEIVDTEGNVTGAFYWNPSDLDIVKRCENVMESFGKIEVPEGSDQDKLFAISDEIKKMFDYLFDTNVSAILFEHCNPLSSMQNGALYAEYVLEVLVKFIESEMNVRMKKTNSRIKKYTDKYKR